jgi:acyl-ACP thioesterase
MAWTAIRTFRNKLHVMNDETLQHFEADTEEEVQEVLAELKKRDEEAAQAAAAAPADGSAVAMPVGETARIN